MNFKQFDSMMWCNFGIRLRWTTIGSVSLAANEQEFRPFSDTKSETTESILRESLENT